MQLVEYKEVQGIIRCLTGLKIGGTKDSLGIGETDNPIIRHPITRFPYIPGSSIKGKLRSLLELREGRIKERENGRTSTIEGHPCGCGKCFVCYLFGSGNPQGGTEPTRLIFRDAVLTHDSEEELKETLPGSFVEVKTEIAMDRKQGKALGGALREQERVPEGIEFEFEMTIRLFDVDKDRRQEYFEKLALGFELLEKDYLGGNGSRGYGQVAFTSVDNTPMFEYIKTLS